MIFLIPKSHLQTPKCPAIKLNSSVSIEANLDMYYKQQHNLKCNYHSKYYTGW